MGDQIHFSIGETFGFADCYYAIVTQGFQQPGESIRTGNANSICTEAVLNCIYCN
jgi:hypothetical protein